MKIGPFANDRFQPRTDPLQSLLPLVTYDRQRELANEMPSEGLGRTNRASFVLGLLASDGKRMVMSVVLAALKTDEVPLAVPIIQNLRLNFAKAAYDFGLAHSPPQRNEPGAK